MAASPTSDRASGRGCRSTIRGSMPLKPDTPFSITDTVSWPRFVWNLPKMTESNGFVRNVAWRLAMDRNLLLHLRRPAHHSGWNRPVSNRQQPGPRGLRRATRPVRQTGPSSQRGGCAPPARFALRRLAATTSNFAASRQLGTMATPAKETGAVRACGMWTRALLKNFVPSSLARNHQLPVPRRVLQHVQPPAAGRSKPDILQPRVRQRPRFTAEHQNADYRIVQLALKAFF